jgi:hypothetical protein
MRRKLDLHWVLEQREVMFFASRQFQIFVKSEFFRSTVNQTLEYPIGADLQVIHALIM